MHNKLHREGLLSEDFLCGPSVTPGLLGILLTLEILLWVSGAVMDGLM